MHDAADAGDLLEAPWTSPELGLPSGDSTSSATASEPRRRLVRLATESMATSLPWLMMMTRSQDCSTSLRMWVLRMMVWSPERCFSSSRISMICLGSRPRGGLIEDEHIGVVDDGLRQADALAVALGELADQLGADVAEGAAADDLVQLRRLISAPEMPLSWPMKVRYSMTSISG